MNTEMVLKVADYIEQHPSEFDMGEWWCETTMCIAGTACCVAGYRRVGCSGVEGLDVDGGPIARIAKRVLGLDAFEAVRLFMGNNWPAEYLSGAGPTAKSAVRYLRDIAAGVVTL